MTKNGKAIGKRIKVYGKILNNTKSRLILKTGSVTSSAAIKNVIKKFQTLNIIKDITLMLSV